MEQAAGDESIVFVLVEYIGWAHREVMERWVEEELICVGYNAEGHDGAGGERDAGECFCGT